MAGDWIKMRSDLLSDPAVFKLSKLLRKTVDEVIAVTAVSIERTV